MISFLLPGFLIAAGAVALGVIALHFLVTQQPKSDVLPTVRFFPDVVARSTSVAIRPSDLWLLLLRLCIIALIGAAFAQPQIKPNHQTIARLVAVDVSRAVANPAELADSAQHYVNGAATVVVFDSTVREITPTAARDSLSALVSQARSDGRGALTPALISLLRSAARVREMADSLELVVVSPFVREGRDAATQTVRSLWPGRVTTVRVTAAVDTVSARSAATSAPRVQWADSSKTTLWVARTRPDTIGAVRAGSAVLVYPFARRWRLAETAADSVRVYARWTDGEPAGVEQMVNGQCIRSLAFSIPTAGDAILRPEFTRFRQGLSAPCGARPDLAPLPTDFMTAFAGVSHLAPSSKVVPLVTRMTPLVPWLLAGALVLALIELLVRARTGRESGSIA